MTKVVIGEGGGGYEGMHIRAQWHDIMYVGNFSFTNICNKKMVSTLHLVYIIKQFNSTL